jgi:hypothetical protein
MAGGTMAWNRQLPASANPHHVAADVVGERPQGQGRARPGALFEAASGLLRHHGLRAFGLALLLAFALAAVLEVVQWAVIGIPFILGGIYGPTLPSWLWLGGFLLAILALTPLYAGYAYMMLGLLQGRKAGVSALFAAYRRGRLWFRVTAAGGVAFLGPFLFRQVWQRLPWPLIIPALDEEAPLARLIDHVHSIVWLRRDLLEAVSILLFVPLAWAGLVAIVSRRSWCGSLARSARLAFDHRRLALAFGIVAVACSFLPYLSSPFASWAKDLSGWRGDAMGWLFILASIVVSSIWRLITSVALVVSYREMVWREREAADHDAAA